MKEYIIEVKGTDIGDQYLQTEKVSLLVCHSYQFLKDNKPFATLVSGTSHSSKRYAVIEMGETTFTIKVEGSFFRPDYVLYKQPAQEEIGFFRFGTELFGIITGTLTTTQNFLFKQVSVWQLFKRSTWNMRKYILSNQDTSIEYTGAFQSDVFNGIIQMNGSEKYLEVIVGVFVIDEKYRLDQERSL